MSVFIHVEGRRHRQSQWAIWVLVCLCVLSFVWFSLCPPARQLQWVTQWGVVPADVLDRHQPWFRQLADPALLRLLTGLFIHVTWLHLLSNMLFLVIFGVPTDRTLGSARFMLLFLLGGVASNLCGAISLEGYRAPIIGCSGGYRRWSALISPCFHGRGWDWCCRWVCISSLCGCRPGC